MAYRHNNSNSNNALHPKTSVPQAQKKGTNNVGGDRMSDAQLCKCQPAKQTHYMNIRNSDTPISDSNSPQGMFHVRMLSLKHSSSERKCHDECSMLCNAQTA